MRKMRYPLFVLLLLVSATVANAQPIAGDYRTRAAGNWTTLTTWERFDGLVWQTIGFAVPSSADGAIELRHNITINTTVTADQITVSAGTTTVTGVFNILDGPGDDVTITTTGVISVTTGTMSFAAGSTYVHGRDAGAIPLATWGSGSTVTVTGTIATSPAVDTASSFWNFIYDCPGQTGTENLLVRDIQGDLIINDTGDNLLRFGTTTGYTLNIDGNFDVGNGGAGTARIAFGTSATGTLVNLAGDFNFNSAGAFSRFASTGGYTFTVAGDISITGGTISMATGTNTGTIQVAGNFDLDVAATILESGAGLRRIVFNGTTLQNLTATGTLAGQIDFEVNNALDDVILGSDLIVGGTLTQTLGDLILNGNILTVNGAFVQTAGNIVVDPSAELIIGGTGTLPATIAFSGVDLNRVRMNRTGVTLTTASVLTTNFLDLYAGIVTVNNPGSLTLVDGGIIERRVGTLTSAVTAGGTYDVVYNNTTAAVTTGFELPSSITELNNLTIQGGQTVNLTSDITINGDLTTTAGVFAAAANSIDLVGNFISNAGFTTTAGGNFTVSGPSSTLTGGASTPVFRNLFITGSFSSVVNFQVNENLNVGVGAALNAAAGTASFGGTTSVITNSGSLTFSGFDLLAASTVTFPATTVRVNGNFDISTGTSSFNNGGGTIQFGGTTNLLGTGAKSFNNLNVLTGSSFSGAVSWTFNGALVNDGTINFTAGLCATNNGSISGAGSTTLFDLDVITGTLTQAAATTISLRDDFDISPGATFTAAATSTVSFITATCSITGTGTKNFANINVPVGGALTHGVIVNVAGNVTVDGTLANGTGTTVFNGGGTSNISGTGTIGFDFLTVNTGTTVNATSNISISDDITANGNFTSTQTVTISGTTVVLAASGVVTFNNLTVNAAVTFTPNDDIIINGNLAVDGTLSDGTANAVVTFAGTTTVSGAAVAINFPFLTITGTLTAHPSVTMNVERDFTNNGTFNHNGGTINFTTTGTVLQQILGSQPITFNNLSVSNVGVATDLTNGSSAGVTIVGTLSFNETNAVFDADGAGAGLLTLASSNDSPAVDGRIGAIPAGSNVSGSFTVERYVSSENRLYRYISVPVVGATVAQLKAGIPVTGTFTDPSDGASTPPCVGCITTSPSLYYWDETTQAYVAYPASGLASSASMSNGRGYSAFFRHTGSGAVGTVTLSFRGTNPAATGISLPVAPGAGGYSLIGNPYPSAIDWASATGWSVRTGFSNIAVVRDNAGVHQSLDANSASPQLIAPGQSFWVQTLVAATPLTINENAKATGSYEFFRLDQPMEDILELTLTKASTGTTDNARIVIREGSTPLYDMYDGYKFNNNIDNGSTITEVQDISTLTVESTPKALAVNAIPSIECSQTFNVKVTNFVNAGETVVNYSLGINPSGAMNAMSWTLHDNYTNADYDLTANGAYSFSVDNAIPASKANNRFTITATAPVLDANKTVTASSPTACAGSDAMITLAASQQGIAYGVEVNGTYYPNVVTGTGGDVTIFIDQDKLQNGANTISVKGNSGCEVLAVGSPVQINQVEIYQAAAASPPAQCASGTFTLEASGAPSDAVYRWYDDVGSSTVLATGEQYTPTVYATRSYFVAAVNPAGCEGTRVEVMATVNDLTATVDITAAEQSVCHGGEMRFTNTASTGVGNFLWYDSAAPDAVPVATVASGETFKATLYKNETFYVRYSPGGTCVSDPIEVQASVIAFDPDISAVATSDVLCKGQKHEFTGSGAPAGSTYRWYNFDGTDSLGTSLVFTSDPLDSSANFNVTAVGPDGCESPQKTFVAVVDDSNPSVDVTTNLGSSSICQETETEISIMNPVAGMTYRWYENATATEPLYEGTTLPATIYSADQSYYLGAVNSNGCETAVASREKIDVKVFTFTEPVLDETFYGVLSTSTAQAYQWYVNGDPIAGEQDQSIRVIDPGYYAVKVDIQGCEAWSNTIFTTDLITSLSDESRIIRLFPNPVSDRLTVHVLGNEPVAGQLLDEQGRVITSIQMMQGDNQWSGELDVRSFARGFYLLRLSSGSKSVTHKVIIQ